MSDREPDDTLVLRPRVMTSDDVLRPTRAEIDLDAVAANYRTFARRVPHGRVLAVVKADAYGHGVLPVARRLERDGAFGFGVALAEEALELRDAGVRGRILVLNGVYGDAHAELVRRDVTPVLYHPREVERFAAVAHAPFPVHLKVDTGMSRLGVPGALLDELLDAIGAHPALRVDGLMTHLSSADDDRDVTGRQLARFEEAVARVRARGHAPTLLHAANSAATIRHPESHLDLVRVGIGLFGHPGADAPEVVLRATMRLRSAVISLRDLPVGGAVGYSGTFTARRPTRIATVAVGYADGYFRALSNRAEVLVHGQRCKVVGNVSMDLVGVDVTDVPGVRLDDEVVLLGRQGTESIDLEELARHAGTIPYEIMTNVSRRVPRFYVDGGVGA